ncbi:acyltransferase family protein [Euzebya rosea]|uniref:acyltransferase family protein n=1 Tax=Euzebya rosea TaxID=2052804 RepID=UPI000D3EDED9|nr:acyltransferase [Euzebya rosea]
MSTTESLQPAATATPSTRHEATTDPRPTTRLRWVDAVRAASLLVVVLGHYLIAVVVLRGDDLTVSALLDIAPWTHPVTWVVQVMACFFAVGAVVAAPRLADALGSPGSAHRPAFGDVWRDHVAGRARQLVVPTLPLLALWTIGGPPLGGSFGVDMVGVASQAALVPLWFLAVYLLVQALLPTAVGMVQRHGVVRPVAALLLAAAAVDSLHLAGVPFAGWLNFPIVWMIPSTIGVAVGLGSLDTRGLWRAGAAALLVAFGLVVVAGYPVPVVGVTDAARSNNSPPSLLLAVHGLSYACMALSVGPRLEGWLGRTAPRRRVLEAAGRWSMAVYLWHMTGLVVLVALAVRLVLPVIDAVLAVEPLTTTWWLVHPVQMVAALAVTVALIAVVSGPTTRLVRLSAARPLPGTSRTLVATALASGGIADVVLHGTAEGRVWGPFALLAATVLLHGATAETRSSRNMGRT